MVVRCVGPDVGDRLRRIGVDANHVDAARFVFLREFLHAFVVSIGNRTLNGNENQYRTAFARQRRE